jgi:hypothetical protein
MGVFEILLVIALVLFVLAAFGVGARVSLGWLGLAVLVLAALLGNRVLL